MSSRRYAAISTAVLHIGLILFGTVEAWGEEIIGYKYYGSNVGTPNLALKPA